MNTDKYDASFFIKEYFKDLRNRIAFLENLYDAGRGQEALLLCNCYIEALGTYYFKNKSPSKNYCEILFKYDSNNFWELIHPEKLAEEFSKEFNNNIPNIESELRKWSEFLSQNLTRNKLFPILDQKQKNWLTNNLYKGSVAMICYSMIRSELVHKMITASTLSFSKYKINGEKVNIDFLTLFEALNNIVVNLEKDKDFLEQSFGTT